MFHRLHLVPLRLSGLLQRRRPRGILRKRVGTEPEELGDQVGASVAAGDVQRGGAVRPGGADERRIEG